MKRHIDPASGEVLSGMTRIWLTAGSIILLLPFLVTAQKKPRGSEPREPNSIAYHITPILAADRTNLEISVRFKTDSDAPMRVGLPSDYFGTPNLYRFVSSFEGEAGTVVTAGKDGTERLVKPGAGGEIHLRYVLSYDPKVLKDFTDAPNVDRGHFHLAGCQWLLQTGEISRKRRYIVEVSEPRGWQLYSSIGPDPHRVETTSSYEDLVQTAIGGGVGFHSRFLIHTKPVNAFVEGRFEIPNLNLQRGIQRIVSLQRSWFNDFDQPFYHVVILPKEANVAGVRFKNLFVCFLKRDIARDQLYVLLAHEMLHNWLTADLVRPPDGESTLRYQWFYEGFTDYFARRLLADAGLISKRRFAYLINRDIINIADNPNRAATYADLIAATKEGGFGTTFNKLAYYRGALIALNWDAQIDRLGHGRQLGDLIREVYRLAQKNDGHVTEQALFELTTGYGIDAKADFEKYILRGEPVAVLSDDLGRDFELDESEVPSFDPGFSLGQSTKTHKIAGVAMNGPAYQVGLREGMDLVDLENATRFGNAWDPDKPLVVIAKVDGLERRFAVFPHGASRKLMLFHARADRPSGVKLVDLSFITGSWRAD
jgi:predicted metalloprotease with PDZ domain